VTVKNRHIVTVKNRHFVTNKNRHIVTVKNVTICDEFVMNLCLAKIVHNENGFRKFQKSFFRWLFCDYLWPCLFLYFTSVLNRLTYIGCCRTNNYQKHFCFRWSNINSEINYGSNFMLLICLLMAVFKQFTRTFFKLKWSQKTL
jgi:hypothetical protein